MGYGNTEVFLSAKEREELIKEYMGKTVEVVIDRPIGYHHVTKDVPLDYTVNYGYLPGVMGGDGDEQDVYVLGVDVPLERFTGRIIGAIRRRDDNEDKLVAAPAGMRFHQGQIAEAVRFVEQYFDSTIECLYRKSCGVIPWRRRDGRNEYLLLFQRGSRTWSFPKGHMEAGEKEQETAARELKEETGLSATFLPDYREVITYRLQPFGTKDVVLFLGEVAGDIREAPGEIIRHRWVTAEEAKKLLWGDYLGLIDRLEEFLRKERAAL